MQSGNLYCSSRTILRQTHKPYKPALPPCPPAPPTPLEAQQSKAPHNIHMSQHTPRDLQQKLPTPVYTSSTGIMLDTSGLGCNKHSNKHQPRRNKRPVGTQSGFNIPNELMDVGYGVAANTINTPLLSFAGTGQAARWIGGS